MTFDSDLCFILLRKGMLLPEDQEKRGFHWRLNDNGYQISLSLGEYSMIFVADPCRSFLGFYAVIPTYILNSSLLFWTSIQNNRLDQWFSRGVHIRFFLLLFHESKIVNRKSTIVFYWSMKKKVFLDVSIAKNN